MKFKLHKYRSIFSSVLLFSYLFLVTITIFHHHNVDIQFGNLSFSTSSSTNYNGPFDKLIDLTHNCSVQQFAGTILNYTHLPNITSNQNLVSKSGISFKSQKLPQTKNYSNNPLRAPPNKAYLPNT